LKKLGYRLKAVIINRAFPLWLPDQETANVTPTPAEREAQTFFDQFRAYYRTRYTLYEDFAKGLDPSIVLARIPEYRQDVHGLDDLKALAETLSAST
jgi:hypothetical protein